ncbi:MAG: SusC/RagA family TonB-linked outer membrane protein [Bacteroidetes bacterium]|nr:SusC/RagA family TonB-linked outer membrane protein [Bacteroidota bacterium]
MRRHIFCLAAMLCFALAAAAQSRSITGKVTDKNGAPLPAISVTVKNSTTGTATDKDGLFKITVPSPASILVFSSAETETAEVSVGSQTFIAVKLNSKSGNLQEVVVTALGIVRDKRSLSYATQNLKAEQIADKGSVNLVGALEGKVAGVNITGASGAAGASTNINIRGITSFNGNNQPLFVIDGIPISNDVDRTSNTLFDNQPANRAIDIDVNNIESVNILKGPAASVLYGSRAAAGAIIITTKKGGKAGGRTEIILNSSYGQQTFSGLPKVQNEYGQGLGGVYNPQSTSSWGPRFDATPTVANGLIVGGVTQNYKAYPNNISDFFETGTLIDNNLTINSGDAKQNFTFSAGYTKNKGILPNNDLNRATIKIGANTVLRDKITVGGSASIINTLQNGIVGGNGASALGVLAGLARSIDLTSYKTNGTYKNADGSNNFLISGVENPYFGAYENTTKSNLYRFIGTLNVGYDITKWLNIAYRLGGDIYTDRRKQVYAITSIRNPGGQIIENTVSRSEINGDLMITAKKNGLFTKRLNATATLGQNINQRKFQSVFLQGDGLTIPGYYNINNATTLTNGSFETTTNRRLLGFYGQFSFAYSNYLFLELTGRADESSTLPPSKSTYFYPSVSSGFVFTDALKIKSNVLSYGKIRASYAKVGRDADPYLLTNVFVPAAFGNNVAAYSFPLILVTGSIPGFSTSSRIAPVEPLSPEFTTSKEVGVNLSFFKNRLSVDLAYFDQDSRDQIINVALAPSTGFGSKTTNIGEMTNKGVELTLNLAPVSTRDFKWDISYNYTRIRNKVISISPGITSFSITGNAFTGSIPSIKVGEPYGVILGGVIPRSPNGQRIINPATGVYQPTVAGQVLANPNPDYSMGITNNFTYKRINLNFTFDFTKGGQVLSFTSGLYKSRGVWYKTAEDRESPRILEGVIEFPAGSGKYIPNNIQIPAQTYWQTLGGLQSEFNVYDATVLRLRELSLGYDVPSEVISKLKINAIRFSIYGRNLFYKAPNAIFDPEVNTQGAGNIRGLELQSAPNARTIGANLKITF